MPVEPDSPREPPVEPGRTFPVGPAPVQPAILRVLGMLADGAGHTFSDIAARALVGDPVLNQLIHRLICAALIYRRSDPRRRDQVLIFLSHYGRDRYEQLTRPDAGPRPPHQTEASDPREQG